MSEKFAELLGIEDEEKQVELIRSLAAAAQAPVHVVTVIVDARKENPEIVSELPTDALYQVCDLMRRELLRREREAVKASAAPAEEPKAE